MLKRIYISLFFFGMCLPLALADGVMREMFQMNRELSRMIEANNQSDFEQASSAFIELSQKALQQMPNSLDNDQNEFKGYQQGMQELINEAVIINNLAKSGQLEEAKQHLNKLIEIKQFYHKRYK